MIDMSSPSSTTRYRFWWKEGDKTRYTYGDEEHGEAPGDWTVTREEAEEVHRRWVLFKVINEDAEWGITEKEAPVYHVDSQGKVVVCLDEEYGYRMWLWDTGMTVEELTRWWTEMATVSPHFMDPSKTLPGKLQRAYPVSETEVAVYREDLADGTVDSGFLYVTTPKGWSAHLHEDDDSYLRVPTGETLHHKGFKDDRCEEGDPRRGGNKGV